jgi:hypothetical protein
LGIEVPQDLIRIYKVHQILQLQKGYQHLKNLLIM